MASIIKKQNQRESPSGPAVRGVAFDFRDLSGHADEYVESVRNEAAKIVQEAHAEAKKVRAQAEKAGREAAEAVIEKMLAERVAKQMETIRPALSGLVDQLADARGAWLDHWDRSAVGLAARMAERVVRGELERRPEVTLDWLREALELASGSTEVVVRLHPNDHKNLGEQAQQLATEMGRLTTTSFVADQGVSPGGCVLETRYGTIDQQVESQLNRLVQDMS